MNCPQCSEAVEADAAFCGNCGFKLDKAVVPAPIPVPAIPIEQPVEPQTNTVVVPQAPTPVQPAATSSVPAPAPANGLPAYALANPVEQRAGTKAMVGLILGVLSLPGAIIPVIGWVLSAVSIVLSSSSKAAMHKKTLATTGIVFACIGIGLSTLAFGYNVVQQQKKASASASQTVADSSSGASDAATDGDTAASTPCYSFTASGMAHVTVTDNSCKAQAYNATSLTTSSNALTVEAVSETTITESNLATAGQQIVNGYLKSSMPDLTVTKQRSGSFAGSPAYYITGHNSASVSIELAIVVHKVTHGENIFVIAHAINSKQADVGQFAADWEWK